MKNIRALKNGSFNVRKVIDGQNIDKSFKTLADALAFCNGGFVVSPVGVDNIVVNSPVVVDFIARAIKIRELKRGELEGLGLTGNVKGMRVNLIAEIKSFGSRPNDLPVLVDYLIFGGLNEICGKF